MFQIWYNNNLKDLSDFNKEYDGMLNILRYLDQLRWDKSNNKFEDIAIAIYSTSSSEEHIEETFVKGANIYIKKPSDFETLKKVLSDVVAINWQYHTSGLNKDSFLLRM